MPDTTRYALAAIYVSVLEAMALATGKPAVAALSGHFMREIAVGAPADVAELCGYLADCADGEQETAQ
jgi:hypothetical protein